MQKKKIENKQKQKFQRLYNEMPKINQSKYYIEEGENKDIFLEKYFLKDLEKWQKKFAKEIKKYV